MSCGHLSAPKASRSGFGLPWNAKRAGLLVWPLVIVPPKRVASCGNRSRLTIANARYAIVTSGSPMLAVLPSKRHRPVGKETGETAHIERFTNTLRQHCANLVRRTLSFSKDEHWHARAHPPFR